MCRACAQAATRVKVSPWFFDRMRCPRVTPDGAAELHGQMAWIARCGTLYGTAACSAPSCTPCPSHMRHLSALSNQQQTPPHRWLNSSSSTCSDSSGAHLTMREAISEHAFRLVDANSTELKIKVGAFQIQMCAAWESYCLSPFVFVFLEGGGGAPTMHTALFQSPHFHFRILHRMA